MILGRPGSGEPAAPESFVPREREQSAEGADGQEAHGLRTTEVRQYFFIFFFLQKPQHNYPKCQIVSVCVRLQEIQMTQVQSSNNH